MNNIESINSRTSIRTYNNENLTKDNISGIKNILYKERFGPFGSKVTFSLLDVSDEKLQALGKMNSYGIIKGTNLYIASYCKPNDKDIIDYGFCFEEVILELNILGLSTCWLGGTFGRSFISDALSLPSGCVVPGISPTGISAEKKSFTDKLVRFIAKASKRKDYDELFFNVSDTKTLIPVDESKIDKELKIILDGIRIAPSASNKQPWRVVIFNRTLHLYWDKDEKYNSAIKGFNIQALDMGIAICHIIKILNELEINNKIFQSDEKFETEEWIYITSCKF